MQNWRVTYILIIWLKWYLGLGKSVSKKTNYSFFLKRTFSLTPVYICLLSNTTNKNYNRVKSMLIECSFFMNYTYEYNSYLKWSISVFQDVWTSVWIIINWLLLGLNRALFDYYYNLKYPSNITNKISKFNYNAEFRRPQYWYLPHISYLSCPSPWVSPKFLQLDLCYLVYVMNLIDINFVLGVPFKITLRSNFNNQSSQSYPPIHRSLLISWRKCILNYIFHCNSNQKILYSHINKSLYIILLKTLT